MQITSVTKLNPAQTTAVNELLQVVHQYDHTFRDPYLSNQFNYFAEMPTFLLAYQADYLVGMAMIYADEEPKAGMVDLYINVAPQFRRQGVGRQLLATIKIILQQYGYQHWQYISEQNFLNANPAFLTHEQLTIPEIEYQLSLNLAQNSHRSMEQSELTTGELKAEQIVMVATLEQQAFGNDLVVSQKYITSGLKDPATIQFVLQRGTEVVGYCAINAESEYYFFDLFIAPKDQHRGYGTIFMQQMLDKLQQKAAKRCVIGVVGDNTPALNLYQKSGFAIETKIVYLQEAK
ncbi:GNAT family N-acetyltransferase [Bombilactobacillus thymidiniphilus]|uniref:GNAT family N-acetyltransferase n=1 Tax=Bombilactobacillus thymidiniphilus TaxID=2923363 RepID=A0ABY4PDV5_9LACO|nr:GNAT family N-acetyltransferase [Bombilactobacillus thymidiniphilus]UQS83959.1 GNAT family N-acetyltransferase [Bombilactobacillus thymidiniphilus]